MPVLETFELGKCAHTAVYAGFFHRLARKAAFFQPFLRFFLAFSRYLGYSAQRPEFFRSKTRGISLAACPALSGWKVNTGG
jgi:hypothetical protein